MTHPPPRHRPCLAAGHDASSGHVAKGRNYENDIFSIRNNIFVCGIPLLGLCLCRSSSCSLSCVRRLFVGVCMVRLIMLLTL